MIYDVDYFIQKFEEIPEDRWTVRMFINSSGQCCAFGHCGYRNDGESTLEGICLLNMFQVDVSLINDGLHRVYQQPTPKQRILAALRDVKDRR